MGDRQSLNDGARRLTVVIISCAVLLLGIANPVRAQEPTDIYPLLFPVAGDNAWTDTWGAPRSDGRVHEGTDIFADKGTPVVAAADGRITRIAVGDRAGRYIVITHDDGWSSYYLHLNNDTPGTDDGLLDVTPEGIAVGVRVTAGDVIDFVGDSGNAELTPAHLHFELHTPDGDVINPAPHLRASITGELGEIPQVVLAAADVGPSYDAVMTELVGHYDPGDGFAAGLTVHEQVVYMGTWGRHEVCPNTGVRIIDATNPADPTLLGSIATADEFPETSTDAVWAGSIDNETFRGDVAVVSVRLCDTGEQNRRSDAFRGLAIYDVTDPAVPELLSTWHSGEFTQGPNDVTGTTREDGTVIVSTTVMQSYLHTNGELGDWRLLDITDPLAPRQIADWDYRTSLDDDDPAKTSVDYHAHSTTLPPDGTTVWVAVWDGGMVELAITEAPTVLTHIPIGEGEEGNAHSIAVDPSAGLLIRNDEDLEWEAEPDETGTWGTQTLYDISEPDTIAAIGTFATERSDLSSGGPAAPGYFSAHEVVLSGDRAYVSWYSDGVRVLDVADPTAVVEVAHFVPSPTPDPQRLFKGQGRGEAFAMVWAVRVVDGLIYLSDLNSGLWIVRLGGGADTVAMGVM